MNGHIDELQLQRLVDDEMTGGERREFLKGVRDDDAEAWREVSLAFVEELIWRREIGNEGACRVETAAPRTERAKTPRSVPWGMVAALAACIFLLPGIGFYFGQATERAAIVAESENPGGESVVPEDSNIEPRQIAQQPPPFQEGPNRLVTAPPPAAPIPQNAMLESMGYRLEPKTRYYAGQLDDGRQLVVPVRTMMVSYHGQ